jgi:hypothetical protein
VVLQDHGFGGNWNRFGRDGRLHQYARENLPRLLYVAPNTTPWPGYVPRSCLGNGEGIHESRRAIFLRS